MASFTGNCGTTGWVAPEVLNEEGYTEKADVYSFAIVLWELLTRLVPYAGKNTMQIVRAVDRGDRLTIPPWCPSDYDALIQECWDPNPAKRPYFTAILPRLEKLLQDYLARRNAEVQQALAKGLPPPIPPGEGPQAGVPGIAPKICISTPPTNTSAIATPTVFTTPTITTTTAATPSPVLPLNTSPPIAVPSANPRQPAQVPYSLHPSEPPPHPS